MATGLDQLTETVRSFRARFEPLAGSEADTRKRLEIMSVTLRIAAAEGVKGASLRRIAAQLGMRTATLYSYFPGGKSELVSTALAVQLEGFYRSAAEVLRVDDEPEENLRRLLFAHTRWMLQSPWLASAALSLARAHALSPIMTTEASQVIEDLRSTYQDLVGELLAVCGTPAADIDRLTALLTVLCENAAAWVGQEPVDDAQELVWLSARRLLGWGGGPRS